MTIPATEQYGRVIRGLAGQLLSVLEQREVLATELEELLAIHPLAEILTSMPGVGLTHRDRAAPHRRRRLRLHQRRPLRLLLPALPPPPGNPDAPSRASTGPAAGTGPCRGALYISAFASLKHPPSRAYYDRKRAEGKSHTAALTCLARRRVDVMHAMIRDRQPYQPGHPSQALQPTVKEPATG